LISILFMCTPQRRGNLNAAPNSSRRGPAAGDESMHEKTTRRPEGIALDYAGLSCGRKTAGPGSVGAREAVREERIGSTLAITATQAEARWAERGA